jgi:hypothetical protein
MGFNAVINGDVSAGPAPFPLTDPSLKALWLFDGDGTDEMGLNDLTVTGDITYNGETKIQGLYSSYASASGQHYSIADASLNGIDFSGDFTVGTWINLTSGAADAKVISKFNAGTNNREFDVFRESSDSSIGVTVSSDGTSTNRVDLNAGAGTWPINTWLNLIVSHDATTHVLRLYKDGVEFTTGSFPYTLEWVPYPDGNSPLYIHSSGVDSSRPGIGYQDETFFANRVLTADEIANIYNLGFGVGRSDAPYAASTYITDVTFNLSSIVNLASGSDNWPITEDSNGDQWSTWGDGPGFQGSATPKASLGVAKVEGTKDSYTGTDTWHSGTDYTGWDGKSKGILAIGTDIYLWRSGTGSDVAGFALEQLYKSTDSGVTFNEVGGETPVKWLPADFSPESPRFANCTFVQFGGGYAAANVPDAVEGYVYIVGHEVHQPTVWNVQTPGQITMMRVPTASIEDKSAYEWYSGAGPTWSTDKADRVPIWEDEINGVMRISMTYLAGISRYILIGQQVNRYTASNAHIGIYESANPWGPWKTVLFENAKTVGIAEAAATKTVFWGLSTKWSSGTNFVMVGTLPGQDEWGSIEGTWVL